MHLTVDATDARKLARKLEKYLAVRGIALARGEALGALAHMLGARDSSALIAMLEKSGEEDREFGQLISSVNKGLGKPFTIYTSASSNSEEACEPRWAKIELTRELWSRIARLLVVVQRAGLLRALDFGDPELWSCESPHVEEDHRVQLSKLVVSNDRFWYSGYIGDIEVNTKEIGFYTLAESIKGSKQEGLAFRRSGHILLCEDDHLQADLLDMLIADREVEEGSFHA